MHVLVQEEFQELHRPNPEKERRIAIFTDASRTKQGNAKSLVNGLGSPRQIRNPEDGKLKQPSLISAATDGTQQSRRLFIKDKVSRLCFLIDTGADVSVIPPRASDAKQIQGILYAANGTQIATYGERALMLRTSSTDPMHLHYRGRTICNLRS